MAEVLNEIIWSMEKILINASYVEDAVFTVDDVDYKVGVNAFTNLNDAVVAMTDDTVELELKSDVSTDFPTTITNDLNFTTSEENSVTATITVSTEYRYIGVTGDFNVGENVTLNFAPNFRTDEFFIQINNDEENLVMNIDGTFINGGGDFGSYNATEDSPTVTINVSSTGKFLSYSTDNTSFLKNSVLYVKGTGTEDAKMNELQFRMGAYGTLAGTVTLIDTNAIIGTIACTCLNGEGEMVVTNSILSTYSHSNDGTYIRVEANKNVTLTDSETTFGKLEILSKAITVDGGSLTIKGTYDYPDGGHLAAGEAIIYDGAALNLTDVEFSSAAFTNGGTLTLNVGTDFDVASFAGADGSIIVDMSDAEDDVVLYKLIDVAGTDASDFGSFAMADGAANGYTLQQVGNDLYAVDQAGLNTIFVVSNAWTEYAGGEAIGVGDVTYYYGLDAFSTVDAAVAGMLDNTSEIKLIDDVDTAVLGDEDNPVTSDLKFTTAAENGATIELNPVEESNIQVSYLAGNLTVGEGVTVDFAPLAEEGGYTTEGMVLVRNDEKDLTVDVDGELIIAGGAFGSTDATASSPAVNVNVNATGRLEVRSYEGGCVNFCENSVLTVKGGKDSSSDTQLEICGFSYLSGEVILDYTVANIANSVIGFLNGDKTMTVNNSILTSQSEGEEDQYIGIISDKNVLLKDSTTQFGELYLAGKTFAVNGGTFTIDAGGYNWDGLFVPQGGIAVDIDAELTLDNVTAEIAGELGNAGKVTLDAATASIKAADYGTSYNVINFGAAEEVYQQPFNFMYYSNWADIYPATGTYSGGTLNIDVDDLTVQSKKVIDIDDVNQTLDDYGKDKVILSDTDNYAAVVGTRDADKGDLFVVDTTQIKVDERWADGDGTDDQAEVDGDTDGVYILGTNAFTSLEDASDKEYTGTRTYEFVAKENKLLTLALNVDSGTTTVAFNDGKNGKVDLSYLVAGSKTFQADIVAGTTYTLSFTGDSAEYTFDVDYLQELIKEDVTIQEGDWTTTSEETDPTQTVEYTANSEVGYCPDETKQSAQDYNFSVAAGKSGEYEITISLTGESTDRVSYTIKQDGGKTYASGSTTGSVTRTLNLTEGAYIVSVDSYDHGAGKYNSTFSVSITASINADVSGDDDTYDGTSVEELAADATDIKFVGLGDKTDWIKLCVSDSGTYDISLGAEELTAAKGLKLNLVQVDGSKKTTLKSVSYSGAAYAAVISDVMLDSTKSYYLQVSAASASTASKNATYTVGLSAVKKQNTNISSDDDTWQGDVVLDTTDADGVTDWVGTQDTIDFVKLTDGNDGTLTAGKYTITLDVDSDTGSRVAATIYRVKTGATTGSLSTVASFNGYDGKLATKTFSCASGYDYYVRFKSVAGSKVSSDYTATLAQA